MSKPHPIELRERVVAFVDEGHGHRESARHFRVSPKFVNDMIKLLGLEGWVRGRLAEQGDLTLDELCVELEREHEVCVHRSAVGRWLHRLGLSHKKNPVRRRATAA